MINKVKEAEIRTKKIMCINTFLEDNITTIKDVEEKTNIPRSTIQRYLNDEQFIKLYFTKDKVNQIKQKLIKAKKEGLSKGGRISQKNNIQLRDNLGHYKGNKKR